MLIPNLDFIFASDERKCLNILTFSSILTIFSLLMDFEGVTKKSDIRDTHYLEEIMTVTLGTLCKNFDVGSYQATQL